MRSVTISVDEAVARWVRVAAAERDVSVSRFIAGLLEENMAELSAYDRAMKRNTARRPRKLKSAGGRYPSRDELHDGPRVRGYERAGLPPRLQ